MSNMFEDSNPQAGVVRALSLAIRMQIAAQCDPAFRTAVSNAAISLELVLQTLLRLFPSLNLRVIVVEIAFAYLDFRGVPITPEWKKHVIKEASSWGKTSVIPEHVLGSAKLFKHAPQKAEAIHNQDALDLLKALEKSTVATTPSIVSIGSKNENLYLFHTEAKSPELVVKSSTSDPRAAVLVHPRLNCTRNNPFLKAIRAMNADHEEYPETDDALSVDDDNEGAKEGHAEGDGKRGNVMLADELDFLPEAKRRAPKPQEEDF